MTSTRYVAAAAAAAAVLAVTAGAAVADPGDPGTSPDQKSAGEIDRSKEYSICNRAGVDLDLVNLFTDAPGMFSDFPQNRGPASYPVISTLRADACQHWQYGISMHNTHNSSAVYMNRTRTAVLNLRGIILPSSDDAGWYTNTAFRYVFDTQPGYIGPTLAAKVDTSTRRVNITASGVGQTPDDDTGSSRDWGSLGTGSLGTGSHDREGRR